MAEFLVTPLLMGPVFLLSQSQFEEPVCLLIAPTLVRIRGRLLMGRWVVKTD